LILDKAPVPLPNNYIDALVRKWGHWGVEIFGAPIEASSAVPDGFQQIVGGETSNNRSRASECRCVGFISNPITPSVGDGGQMPRGWQMFVEGTPPITRFGYLSGLMGYGAENGSPEGQYQRALSSVAAIAALYSAIEIGGCLVNPTLLFHHLVMRVEVLVGTEVFRVHRKQLLRALAGATFNALQTHEYGPGLLNNYIDDNESVKLAFLDKDEILIREFDLDELANSVLRDDSTIPAANLQFREKVPLYWAAPDKGFYELILAESFDFLDALVEIDHRDLANGGTSRIAELARRESSTDMIEMVYEMAREERSLATSWESVMNRFYEGALGTLAFIQLSQESLRHVEHFYAYDLEGAELSDGEILEVARDRIPVLPAVGSIVSVNDLDYRVTAIDAEGSKVRLSIQVVGPSRAQD
jgi:hypothetical protein